MLTQGVSMAGPEGKQIQSVAEMIGRFTGELVGQTQDWQAELIASPGNLESIERQVHQVFARGGDMLVAGLLAVAISGGYVEQAAEETRRSFSRPLLKGRERTIAVRLLGGMILWMTTLYCPPKRRRFRHDAQPRVGLDVTLAQFGFGKGVSPGLESRVTRKVALCPSIRFAHEELAREGVELDPKSVKRIAYQCGEDFLALRTHRITQFRAGTLQAGSQLAGKRVSVQIDGGRIKIRGKMQATPKRTEIVNEDGLVTEDAQGRSSRQHKRTFQADWREPKLMTIFVHDERGKMIDRHETVIDGTLLGPDAIAEVCAMHLHRLGAAKARSICFIADGAPWIWDRIDSIVHLAKLDEVAKYEILDCSHAVHHISLALAATGASQEGRLPLYRELRTLLRNGRWREVVEQLTELQDSQDPNADLEREINYLRSHGEAGRLSYPHFRSQGLPCGSGAIESSIRRVINLRLKSNAMFWTSHNAESMMQVRSHVISGQWDKQLKELGSFRRTIAYDGHAWTPRQMSCKTETVSNNST